VSESFLTQYVSRRETKRNNHHLLTVKIRQSDSLKSFIGNFWSLLAKVPNCSEGVYALTFISGMRLSNPLYKHLLKHNVTRMSKILSQAQPYIQLEEAMKTFSNYSVKPGDHGEKSKSPSKPLPLPKIRIGGNLPTREALPILSPSPLCAYNLIEQFTLFKLPINKSSTPSMINPGSCV